MSAPFPQPFSGLSAALLKNVVYDTIRANDAEGGEWNVITDGGKGQAFHVSMGVRAFTAARTDPVRLLAVKIAIQDVVSHALDANCNLDPNHLVVVNAFYMQQAGVQPF
jgi:hypothetical protein